VTAAGRSRSKPQTARRQFRLPAAVRRLRGDWTVLTENPLAHLGMLVDSHVVRPSGFLNPAVMDRDVTVNPADAGEEVFQELVFDLTPRLGQPDDDGLLALLVARPDDLLPCHRLQQALRCVEILLVIEEGRG